MRRPPAVARVLERVTATAREHEMFLPGQTVLVCVSGGPDSVCLLESLVRLRRLFKIQLEVFHLDHRLRPDSAKDAAYVKRLADRHRLPFHLRVAASEPTRGESVEAWGRAMRLWHARSVQLEVGADRIARGHTVDDQAETILMALMSGAGLSGLGGIAPMLGPQIEPLIGVTRGEVETFCRSLGLRPREDPTNRNTRFLRNAVRLKILPDMERWSRRELRAPLARTADLLRADEHVLSQIANRASERVVEEVEDGLDLDAAELLTLPRPIASRVVRSAIRRLPMLPTEESIDAVLDLAGGRSGRSRDLASGSTARRDREYVHLSRPSPEGSDRGRGAP
jgi:tRNA(Ile)-lysidine synthase